MRYGLATLMILGVATATVTAPLAAKPAIAVKTARPDALKAFDAKIEATKEAMMGDPAVARKTAEQAVAMANDLAASRSVSARDAAISVATAKWLLAESLIGLNEGARAKTLVGEALAQVERHHRGSKLNGDLLRSRATLAEMSGDLESALKDYLRAHGIFRRIGEARSQAIALQDIGGLYLEAKDFDRVRDYYGQSLEVYGDDPWLNLTTYNNRGQAWREQGKLVEAEREYRQALTAARTLESPLLEARIRTNLADVQADAGNLDGAAATIAAAVGLTAAGEGAGWRPFVDGVRAKIAAARGDLARASALLSGAFAGQDLAKTEMPFRELHKIAASVYERAGDRALALAHFKAFQRLDSEALQLTASASSQLMSAQFDFANQNLRISQLKQGQLQRDVTIAQQRANLFAGLGAALLVIFALLSFGYVSIRRSRNQVRAANVELSATNVELEKALKARTDFLATTSHEIRTPLNGILGMTQVLLADKALNPDTRERVELLMGAGETMKSLVDDILDVAKMESGEVEVVAVDTELGALLSEVSTFWGQAAEAKGLKLALAIDAVPARVMTDGDRLRQLLANLLSNAIKFTREGHVSLEVRGRNDGAATVVEFAIRDTGIGIAEEDRERIFEPFIQANNTTTREFSGTGLGLAICQRLAASLGGEIAVESVVGEGSCFRFALPLQPSSDRVIDAADAAPATAATLAQASLLLLDRNPANHALMRMLLGAETRAFDIVTARGDALARIEAAEIDHILVEGASAADDGVSMLEGVREIVAAARAAGVRVSLLAAPNASADAAQLAAAGADQLILKPVGLPDLVAALHDAYAPPPAESEARAKAA